MIEPAFPLNEKSRTRALRNLDLIKDLPEQEYDQITKLAAYICRTPISLISLIGKKENWFKSKVGTDLSASSRKYSLCGHAILNGKKLMEISDTRKDERFKDNPFTLAPDPVIFYSGVPLVDKEGHALGTLCVIDNVPRQLDEQQKEALQSLANQVTNLFELRGKNNRLRKVQKDLRERNEELKNFAGVLSHDMKMPLANIALTIDLIKGKFSKSLPADAVQYLNTLKNSSFSLSDYISGILEHYESDQLFDDAHKERFDLHELLEDIVDLLNITEDCQINFPKKHIEVHGNKIALKQVLLNLINNSLKYNDKKEIIIDIKCKEDDDFYYFKVKDNGIGIPKEKQDGIFQLFSTIAEMDRHGKKGNGVGLSTVKKLVKNLHGTIKVSSKLGQGSNFKFTMKKAVMTKRRSG